MLQYLGFRLLALLAPRLPVALGYWLCDRVGDAAYILLARQRRTVRRNLSFVLRGRREGLGRLARQVFREGAKYYFDTFRIPALSDADLNKLISLEGWDHLVGALERGRGAIVATAHLGSPALVAQIAGLRGVGITTPAESVRPRKLFDLMCRVRGGRGIRMLALGLATNRELAAVLRRNETVGIVMDRDVLKTGVRVRLFGAEVSLPTGPVVLALRAGAPIVPTFTYRRRDGHFSARLEEPLELERTGDLREDVRVNTQKLARVLERAIARSPDQWVVFEPIWPEEEVEARSGAAN